MATDLYTDLYQLQSCLGDCPDGLIKLWLRRSAMQFCRETDCWRVQLPTIYTVADEDQYDLRLFASGTHDGGDASATLGDSGASWTADNLIGLYAHNTTDGSYGTITDNDETTVTATLAGGTGNDWDDGDAYEIRYHPWDALISRVTKLLHESDTQFSDGQQHKSTWSFGVDEVLDLTWDPPNDDETLDAWVVLWPNLTCESYDDDLYKRWGTYWVDGAIAHLASIIGKPWSNPALAPLHYPSWEEGLRRAKRENHHERQDGDISLTFPQV